MLTIKQVTSDYKDVLFSWIVFVSQNNVYLRLGVQYKSIRMSKFDLIGCIRYFLDALSSLGYDSKIKSGFNLSAFKYYELSVYLHGLIQLYLSILQLTPISDLHIKRFSHLPHDVLKPEKPLLNIEYAVLHDMKGLEYCVCVTDTPRLFRTFAAMEIGVDIQLSHKYRLNFVLVNELPF